MSIKILIADDHQIMRDGLRALFDRHADLDVVAEAENGRTAIRLVRELSPDVVVMDITMPELNGIEATARILNDAPGVRVVALSMHSDRRFVREVFRAGASGYVLKDCAFEQLANAIRVVAANQTYLCPGVADVLIKDYVDQQRDDAPSVFSVLTVREREVLQLLAEGQATREIADRLHVSVKTVETHRQNIMQKLNIHNVAGLTKYAIREGLTSLES